MSQVFSFIWPLLKAYSPGAASAQPSSNPAKRFGAFQATYAPPGYGIRRPKNNEEAQRLYNHIRTVAYWLDAAPLLTDLGLPFKVGLDSIIGLVPLYGDIASGILQLYQVYLSFLFGVDYQILGYMILMVLADTFIGILPILGDMLDFYFKSNLRNLKTLEDWLLDSPSASHFSILLMPLSSNNDFIPSPPRGPFKSWGSSSSTAKNAARAASGRTRRMERDEGASVNAGVSGEGEEVPLGQTSAGWGSWWGGGKRSTRATPYPAEASAGTRRRENAGVPTEALD